MEVTLEMMLGLVLRFLEMVRSYVLGDLVRKTFARVGLLFKAVQSHRAYSAKSRLLFHAVIAIFGSLAVLAMFMLSPIAASFEVTLCMLPSIVSV